MSYCYMILWHIIMTHDIYPWILYNFTSGEIYVNQNSLNRHFIFVIAKLIKCLFTYKSDHKDDTCWLLIADNVTRPSRQTARPSPCLTCSSSACATRCTLCSLWAPSATPSVTASASSPHLSTAAPSTGSRSAQLSGFLMETFIFVKGLQTATRPKADFLEIVSVIYFLCLFYVKSICVSICVSLAESFCWCHALIYDDKNINYSSFRFLNNFVFQNLTDKFFWCFLFI